MWLNEGEYMAWLDPRVNALAQFEFVDSPPKSGEPPGSQLYWSSFQTGLVLRNGTPKPSLQTFRIPIWLPVARHGSAVTIWGQLRPANHAAVQYGVLDFRPRGGTWSTVRVVQTASPEGFVLAHIPIPGPGSVRLGWLEPRTHRSLYSRTVTIH